MTMRTNNDKNLDQFYTNPLIADQLVNIIANLIPDQFKKSFLEPSAGTGNFIKALHKKNIPYQNIQAYDIDPKDEHVQKKRLPCNATPFLRRADNHW